MNASEEFLSLLDEISLLASSARPPLQQIKSFCGSSGPCCRKALAGTSWPEVQGRNGDFRALGIDLDAAPDSRLSHLERCPFSRRWKRSWDAKSRPEESFRQTAFLRCWLSRDDNRQRLFAANVRLLTAGFAFLDQALKQVVYSTGRHGLIYLPFYRVTDATNARFDPLDRFKHDLLSILRQRKDTHPPYAQIFNRASEAKDLRSPFEKRHGIILVPDGEISCFALNYFLRAFRTQKHGGSRFCDPMSLTTALKNSWNDPIDLLQDQNEDTKVAFRGLLRGVSGIDGNPSGRFGDPQDYAYVNERWMRADLAKVGGYIDRGEFAFTMPQYLEFLGLFDKAHNPTRRMDHLKFWTKAYLCHQDHKEFLVPEIQAFCNGNNISPFPTANTPDNISHFLGTLAFAFNFSCFLPSPDPKEGPDPWGNATRTTFLGHTIARSGSTAPSCWIALPIQAERGSQTTAEGVSRAAFREVGFFLGLLDASEVQRPDGKFSYDFFANSFTSPGEAEGKISKELRKVKAFSQLLAKIESDKVYWMEIIRHRTLREARKTAVAAIASQSLSHNIGSHALSDAELFTDSPENLEVANADLKGLKDFHHFLQGRLDYVAQLIAKTPPQPEPMYLFQDVLCEFFRQRLLLNCLVSDRGINGQKISFHVEFPGSSSVDIGPDDIAKWTRGEKQQNGKWETTPLQHQLNDFLVAIPGGSVGRHALYSVLENMIRNSAKYGLKRQEGMGLVITMKVRDPGSDQDYWLLELWDNFSGFSAAEEKVKYRNLCDSFSADLIDEKQGTTRSGGHGLVEIKEAMLFLHHHKDSPSRDAIGQPSPWPCAPQCHRTSPNHQALPCGENCTKGEKDCCFANVANVWDATPNGGTQRGTLVYRIRLLRPRLLGVWGPGLDITDGQCDDPYQGVFFRKRLTTSRNSDREPAKHDSLVELAPHLMIVVDPGAGEPEIMKELVAQHWNLPFRLLVITNTRTRKEAWLKAIAGRQPEQESVVTIGDRNGFSAKTIDQEPSSRDGTDEANLAFLPPNRVRVVMDDLHTELSKSNAFKDGLCLVNTVYDLWLSSYKKLPDGSPWHLTICFERGAEIKHRWRMTEEFNSWSKSSKVALYTKTSQLVVAHASGVNLEQASVKPSCIVHFGNHASVPSGVRKPSGETDATTLDFAFSQQFGTLEAPQTFHILYTPPSESEPFKFYVLGIIEAALTSVAVFDERMLAAAFRDNALVERESFSPSRVSAFQKARIIPLFSVGPQAIARTDTEWNLDAGPHWTFPVVDRPSNIGRCYRSATFECDFVFKRDNGHFVAQPTLHDPDVLVLHEGLVEELVSHGALQSGFDLDQLKKVCRVVRTSGKGRESRQMDSRHPFAEYSAVGSCFAAFTQDGSQKVRIEKLLLVRKLLNTIGTP